MLCYDALLDPTHETDVWGYPQQKSAPGEKKLKSCHHYCARKTTTFMTEKEKEKEKEKERRDRKKYLFYIIIIFILFIY